ncbi:hypothetical protein FVE85_8199 [Porphyridium purpureum]|uniref:Uncharacterized protein n=1 Tax=Porphyridium purpureum TaxID=35688 RepID=A0A5J4YNZ1_PORPP|nr:hypothetical protein FVE85_8199 [Porphyridium purpureum]|eukprot:POR1314..scf295_9
MSSDRASPVSEATWVCTTIVGSTGAGAFAMQWVLLSLIAIAVLVCTAISLSGRQQAHDQIRIQDDDDLTPLTSGTRAPQTGPPPRIVLGVVNTRNAGVGNAVQYLFKFISLARCLDVQAVLPTHSVNKIEPANDKRFFFAEDLVLYDLDVMSQYASIVHFGSACRCIDVVVQLDGTEVADTGSIGGRIMSASPLKIMYLQPRSLSPDELIAELLARVPISPSRCNNPLPCVVLGNHQTAVSAMDRIDRRTCRGRPLTSLVPRPPPFPDYSDELAAAFVVPGRAMHAWARSLLPPGWDYDRLLVVHLRYACGEYKRMNACNGGEVVCVGRNEEPLRAMNVTDFARLVRLLAEKSGCKYVIPILPPQFTSQTLRSNIARAFNLNFEDLVSSKNLDLFWTLMAERTLATFAKVLIDETRSSFSSTIEHARERLGLTPFLPLWQTIDKMNETGFEIIAGPKMGRNGGP